MKKFMIIASGILCWAALCGGREMPAANKPGETITTARPAALTPRSLSESAWVSIGPPGGENRALARNPKFPNVLYAAFGEYPSQIFRSVNGAKTWSRALVLDSSDIVHDIVADPTNAAIAYIYTGTRILKSTDRGLTFPDSISLPENFLGEGGRMAIHPSNSKTFIITGSVWTDASRGRFCPAVAKSMNGGRTWTLIKFDPASENGYIYDIEIHPTNPNIVLVCGQSSVFGRSSARVFRSTDGGESYKNVAKSVLVYSWAAYAVAFHPTDANTAVVALYEGIARTTDGGRSWDNPPSTKLVMMNTLEWDKADPNTIYGLDGRNTEGNRGCWKSSDGGVNWTNTDDGIYGAGRDLLVDGRTLIAGTWGGVFKSVNAGSFWTDASAGIHASRANAFAVAPSSARTIYSEVAHSGLFKTANGGGAWARCPSFDPGQSILGFLIHPSNPKTLIFLAGSEGEADVYKSVDGAQSIKLLFHKDVAGIFGNPNNPNRIIVTGKVHDSDSGPRYIGMYLSSDGGDTWTPVKIANITGYSITAAAFAPSNSNIIFAGGPNSDFTKGIVYMTMNGGTTWTRLPWPYEGVQSIAVDPRNPKIVYAGADGQGTYRSANGGQTWTKTVGPEGGASSIVIPKSLPDDVIVGGVVGLYRSRDRGLTWTDISEGLVDKHITHLEYHAGSRTLFAGTYNAGIWKKKL